MNAQEIYDQAIAGGASPRFAEMLAARQPPGTRGTDRAFLEGRVATHDIERQPWFLRDEFAKRAKGHSIAGKVYQSSLASYPGDPFAYVSDVAELKAKCAAKGIGGRGIVNIPDPVKPPTPHVALAEDIVQEEVQKVLLANPGKRMDLREVREQVIDKHAPPAAKKRAKEKLT